VIPSPRSSAPIIQLPLFEGPLEMLLSLVERRQLPITELSLAAVADQYLSQVRALEVVDQDALADFLVIAARLLLIKARALLPQLTPTDEPEEESAEDLVHRLEAYRAFKLLAMDLAERVAAGRAAYARGAGAAASTSPPQPPLEPIPPDLLASLLAEIEGRTRPGPAPEAPLAPQVSVEERLALLRDRLGREREVDWRSVAGDTVQEIVATLLAVLELVRRGELGIEQPELFGPITLRRRATPAPSPSGRGLG